MYEQITKDQFQGIMEQLTGKPVWLKVRTDTISVDVFYEKYEFLSFLNGRYQFGHLEYQPEREYENLLIDQSDIIEIHRDLFASDIGAEQIILYMKDGTKIFVEYNY